MYQLAFLDLFPSYASNLLNLFEFLLFCRLSNTVSGLRSRYAQLYIPSDFIFVKNTWHNSLPINRTLRFNSRCLFHVMRKEASSPVQPTEVVYDPPDADHTWTVKVLFILLAVFKLNFLNLV